MFNKVYGYLLRHPATKRGYWGRWYYKGRYEKVLENLSKFCRNKQITILDLGCGLGIYAQYLEKMGCKCDYVGCDIDAKSLRSAYRGYNVDYVMCDIQRLSFKERSAQVVLCSEVLEHLPSPYEVLANICKIPTETLIITFPEERILSTFKDRHPEHVSAIDRETMVNLLMSRKFKLVQDLQIFSSFVPCGILEFLGIPRNQFTQTIVGLIDRLLKKVVPSTLVPHKTILIEAKLTRAGTCA
jgi:SAM-dependent methyltransferase